MILLYTLFLLTHVIDMFYTVLFLSEMQDKYINYYDIELNYHKIFIKRFGLFYGSIISFIISFFTFAIIGLIIYFFNYPLFMFCFGMSFIIAYKNIIEYHNNIKIIPTNEFICELIRRKAKYDIENEKKKIIKKLLLLTN